MQGTSLPISTPMSSYQHYASQMARTQPQYLPLSANSYGNIIWVQGESGAKSYLVPPNSPPTLLLDSEANRFYIKSADSAGMPTLKGFQFSELILEGSPEAEIAKARQETEGLKTELEALRKELADLKQKQDTLIIQEEPRYVPQPIQQPIQQPVQQPIQHTGSQHPVPADVQRQGQQYITVQSVSQPVSQPI